MEGSNPGSLALVCATLLGTLLDDLIPEPTMLQSARWRLKSDSYKREVLAQPTAEVLGRPELDKGLRHIEWDGWGWGGNYTVVYLVFDPDNGLANAASSGSKGKYPGIPCEVYRVRRLESHWYTVHFYTDSDWNHCP